MATIIHKGKKYNVVNSLSEADGFIDTEERGFVYLKLVEETVSELDRYNTFEDVLEVFNKNGHVRSNITRYYRLNNLIEFYKFTISMEALYILADVLNDGEDSKYELCWT